jgi:hypothetical protein
MDESRFEALVRYLSTTPSRRHALRVLAGSTLGGFLAIDQLTTNAKKKKGKSKGKKKGKGTPPCVDSSQVTICHNGLTISVSNCALPAHQAHGDTVGACFCFDKPAWDSSAPRPDWSRPTSAAPAAAVRARHKSGQGSAVGSRWHRPQHPIPPARPRMRPSRLLSDGIS